MTRPTARHIAEAVLPQRSEPGRSDALRARRGRIHAAAMAAAHAVHAGHAEALVAMRADDLLNALADTTP